MATTDESGDDAPKYAVSDRERAYLDAGVSPTRHAVERHRQRAPPEAAPLTHALRHASRDEYIVEHPFYSRHEDGPTHAVLAYRGRTVDGTAYGMVYPVAESAVVTGYRLRSIPDHAEQFGVGRDVGVALKTYLQTLGEQGGVVDE